MSKASSQMAGIKGQDYQNGAGTIVAPTGKKIKAIAIQVATNITNFKYTPKKNDGSDLDQVTVSNKGYMGIELDPTGPTSWIALEYDADSVTIASGGIFVYYG